MRGVEEEKTLNGGTHRELAGDVGRNILQFYRGNHWVALSRMYIKRFTRRQRGASVRKANAEETKLIH